MDISSMVIVATANGSEVVPVLADGAAKSVTVDVIAEYVLAQAYAVETTSIQDEVALLTDDSSKVTVNGLAVYCNMNLFGNDAIDIAANDTLAMYHNNSIGTVTIDNVVQYIVSSAKDDLFNTDDLSSVTVITDSDVMYIEQSGTLKKVTYASIAGKVLETLASYISDQNALQSFTDNDFVVVVRAGVAYKTSVSNIVVAAGQMTDSEKVNLIFGVC